MIMNNKISFTDLGPFVSRVGIEIPKIEVRFDSLNVDTEAYVESRALPTLLNFTINFFEVIFSNFRTHRQYPSRTNHLRSCYEHSGELIPYFFSFLSRGCRIIFI